jgi:hypothetical protein
MNNEKIIYCPNCKFALTQKINDLGGFRLAYRCGNANSPFYETFTMCGNTNGEDGNLTVVGCLKGENKK